MVRGFSRFVPFLFLGLLRAPTGNSPKRVRDTIWTFPEKSGKPPGLETPRFSFSQNPVLPFLVFLEFLVFSPARSSLFLSVFPLFPGILGVRQEQKILVFWWVFPCLFHKNKERKDRGMKISRLQKQYCHGIALARLASSGKGCVENKLKVEPCL